MKRVIFGIAIALFAHSLQAAMILPAGGTRIKIFYSLTDVQGWHAALKGKVISYSSKNEHEGIDLFEKAQDKSAATVRLYSAEGIKSGDLLYVINQDNLITAKMKVRSVFRSAALGDMLVGYGNFRLSAVGDRVVQRADDEGSRYAFINKARGDYYNDTGSEGEAIMEYNRALKLDRNNPGAHLALGLIYKKQGMDQFAAHEFQEGYKNINRMYDNDDRFELLANMAEIRYKQVYESFISASLRSKYRGEGIKYSSEALQLYPASDRINFILGVFYSRWEDPDDKKARDCFLRVVEIDSSNADAYVALSKLYYKHDNMKKARLFAEKAMQADARNESAQVWLRKIEEKEQLK
jgi:tetratricopeptide (TPR) repeat protein